MRIGIFETEHFEGAYPIIKLFDNGKNDITIFTYEKPYRQFKYLFQDDLQRYSWVVKEENESRYRFIYRIYKESKKRNIELLYLNTILDNHFFYVWMIRRLSNLRIIVTLHAINNHFYFKPAFSLRRWVRNTGKKQMIRSVKEFNVVSSTMISYLQSFLPAHKKVYALPGAVFEGRHVLLPAPSPGEPIKLVVPGTVDVRRRNYEAIFELLEQCNGRSIPISIVLLGGYYGEAGKAILQKCKAYAANHNNLHFYETEVVDQPEFDRVMNDAHFVFIPSVIDTVLSDDIEERYGQSISSGNLFDIIKHAKPFIVPAALALPADLKGSAITYNTVAEIVDMLPQHISRYEEFARKAVTSSQHYTIEEIRKKYPTLFGTAP